MSEEKCKYLGENWGDCWKVSGNVFQKCISKNKEKCILLKNEQLHNKIDNLEQQLQTAKEENEKLKIKLNKPIFKEYDTLTQQNKQMREYIGKAEDIARTYQDYRPCLLIKKELQQALKGVE